MADAVIGSFFPSFFASEIPPKGVNRSLKRGYLTVYSIIMPFDSREHQDLTAVDDKRAALDDTPSTSHFQGYRVISRAKFGIGFSFG